MRPSGTINPFPPEHRRKLHRRRHPIVADAVKDRIVQPSRQRLHPGRLRVVNANNRARRNPHKLRRLHPPRHRHRRLCANNGGNGLSVRRKLRRLHPLLRLQRRLPLRQRLRQNRPIPITAKNRTATGKTTGPIRPDPVHRMWRIKLWLGLTADEDAGGGLEFFQVLGGKRL